MKRPLIFSALLILLVSSCTDQPAEQQVAEDEGITVTREQFISQEMKIGTPENIALDERIHFSGKIVSQVNGMARITAPVEGIVREVKVYIGQEVRPGTELLRIGGNALIELQQEFATSSATISQLEANYKRAKALYDENIKSENEFLLAESAYKSEKAKYTALKLKIQQIGLGISSIENGNYASSYSIKSPIEGQITQLDMVNGQYIGRETEIAEIISKGRVELQLSFFEKDIQKIKKGQKVLFGGMDQAGKQAMAVISRVGTKLNPATNTVECYATIDKEYINSLTINQVVNGEVVVATDSVMAVPQDAVITEGNHSFVVAIVSEDEEGFKLEKEAVKTGKSGNNYIELIDFEDHRKLLMHGIEYIGMD